MSNPITNIESLNNEIYTIATKFKKYNIILHYNNRNTELKKI